MALIDNDSILMSTKKLLNVEHNDSAFDTDIGMLINAEFMTLHQLGIGPDEGFSITDAHEKWTDFSSDKKLLETVKAFIFMKVRMIFDPPASSVVADAYKQRIAELEWRLNIQAETDTSDGSGSGGNVNPNEETTYTVDQKDEQLIIQNIPVPVDSSVSSGEMTVTQTTNSVRPSSPPHPPDQFEENPNPELQSSTPAVTDNSDNPTYTIEGETLNIFGNLFF